MSLLLSQGHPHAGRYPLARVWLESQIIKERVNAQTATEAVLMHATIIAVIQGGKAQTHFDNLLKRLE